jgi:hypothetical protein
VALERTASFVFLVLAIGCGPVVKPVETPGPPTTTEDEEILLQAELDELPLAGHPVDPAALCSPSRSTNTPEPSCAAPPELGLDEPGLRDPRREPSVSYLWTPERYAKVIVRLENALARTLPKTQARRKVLGWLATAYDRWRATQHAWDEKSDYERPLLPSPCLIHYLDLLANEVQGSKERGLVQYALALELERAGNRSSAEARYAKLANGRRRTPALSLSHAALGDLAFRRAFCAPEYFPIAYRHYLAAAHGSSLPRFRVKAYARLRLGQLDREKGSLGPSARQLDLAEAEGIYPGGEDIGPRAGRLRRMLESALGAVAEDAVADGTLALLTAFEPPSASFCIALGRIAKRTPGETLNPQLHAALTGACHPDDSDEARECARTPGCSSK